MLPDDDFLARLAAHRAAPRALAAADCPDPTDVAAYAEGTLDDSRRDAVESHLLACGACLEAVAALSADALPAARTEAAPSAVPAGRLLRLPRRLAFVAAAAVVVVAGLAIALQSRRGDDDPSTPPATGDRWVAAADRFAAKDPALASAARPLTDAELGLLAPDVLRGGLAVRRPQGLVFGVRPHVRIDALPGTAAYHATVTDPEGTTVAAFDFSGVDAPWPADAKDLAPGVEFVLRVEAKGPGRRASAVVAFQTATDAEVDADRKARDLVSREAPADLAPLLSASRALRLSAFEAAEADLLAARAKGVADPRVARLLDALARRIGPASLEK